MKINNLLVLIAAVITMAACQNAGSGMVEITTEFGKIEVELYDSAPLHKENFIKLVNDGFYEDLLFHRCIPGFMIQGGDPKSKDAPAGQPLGMGGPGYTIPNEIKPENVHYRGALAAARRGGPSNPNRESSGSQFYLVTGRQVNANQLASQERRFNFAYTEEQKQKYLEVGGTPMLDMDYTVFGQVVSGFDVLDAIAAQPRNSSDRPNEDIKMNIKIK